ncbi:hypothetical protein P3W24_08905 [Luteibacter sp. PPL201]|uniref:DUF1593 domain-containing protein n=1 Tax=Luteibacter sahnii TaxID=3021977 RepID=A0ABT6BAC7_9GAMM
MRKPLLALIALGSVSLGVAHAASLDDTRIPSVVVISVDDTDEPAGFSRLIDGLLAEGRRVALSGTLASLKRLRPSFAYVWPSTNTVVLDPAAGLGIFGFDAADDASRDRVLSLWPWEDDPLAAAFSRVPRAASDSVSRHVKFDVLATSPAAVCQSFGREMTTAMFKDVTPTSDQRAAFRKELRRWCQHGHLSVHLAEPAPLQIDTFATSDQARLTLASEWALIRSDDVATGTRYFFWNKTLGDGAGNGFTLGRDHEGRTDGEGGFEDVIDVAIHSGWGDVYPGDDTFAWPTASTFPLVGNVRLFRCDGPDDSRPSDCPVAPMVRNLYPTDSVDGSVNRASGESFAFGGEAAVVGSAVKDGLGVSVNFGLATILGTSTVSHSDMTMTSIRSNADRIFSRSTWWRPDVLAMVEWIRARRHEGSLAKASPLAGTVNPRYEILWELPANGNGGRTLPYHVFYELGVNACTQGCVCRLAGKPRVGWVDHVLVHIPAD